MISSPNLGSSNGELHDLTNRLVDRATAYRMEVSKDKKQDQEQQHEQHQYRYQQQWPEVRGGDINSNSMNNISADISMNVQKLEEVTSTATA